MRDSLGQSEGLALQGRVAQQGIGVRKGLWTRFRWLVLALLGLAGAAVAIAYALVPANTSPWVGKPARDFSVPTTAGTTFTLSEHRGNSVVLLFMTPYCPSCEKEVPALARVYQEFGGSGLQIVALNVYPNEYSATELEEYRRQIGGGDHLWAQDEGGVVARAYELQTLGTTVVINGKGDIAYRDEAATSYKKLRQEVEEAIRASQAGGSN